MQQMYIIIISSSSSSMVSSLLHSCFFRMGGFGVVVNYYEDLLSIIISQVIFFKFSRFWRIVWLVSLSYFVNEIYRGFLKEGSEEGHQFTCSKNL